MRLIEADELKTAFPCGEYVRTESVRATIDSMPTIDAEPVVRCRDCTLDREAQCPMKYATEPDDYCSWGERMEEE